jgi:hypothetical protein
MVEIVVFSLFSIWLALNLVYVFKRSILGEFGKFLHRWGWLNEWSMFADREVQADTYQIFYSDFNVEEEFKWQLVDLNQLSTIRMILNPNFRFNFFLSKCLKKMNVQRKKKIQGAVDQDVFGYLCGVILQLPKRGEEKFRKIKVEKYSKDGLLIDSIKSQIFKL